MGAWGHQTFEDDCALDWVYDFESKKDKRLFLKDTFQGIIDRRDDELETDEGSWVLAAAEVLAALKGFPPKVFPAELAAWVAQNLAPVEPDQIAQALEAIAIIKNPETSELAALWEEAEDGEWPNAVAELEARLQSLSLSQPVEVA